MVSANKKGNGEARFPFPCDNKRYHTLHYHLQELFPCRVGKAVIDAGFTCPNVDGTKAGAAASTAAREAGNLPKAPFSPLLSRSAGNYREFGKSGRKPCVLLIFNLIPIPMLPSHSCAAYMRRPFPCRGYADSALPPGPIVCQRMCWICWKNSLTEHI